MPSEPGHEFEHEDRRRRNWRCRRPVVVLSLKNPNGAEQQHKFIFDTGSDFTFFPASLAVAAALPFPTDEATLKRRIGLKGRRWDAHLGTLRCKLGRYVFDLPTLFYFPTGQLPPKPRPKEPDRTSPTRANRPVTVEEWAALIAAEEARKADERAKAILDELDAEDGDEESIQPLLLGRAAVLELFHITITKTHTLLRPHSPPNPPPGTASIP